MSKYLESNAKLSPCVHVAICPQVKIISISWIIVPNNSDFPIVHNIDILVNISIYIVHNIDILVNISMFTVTKHPTGDE